MKSRMIYQTGFLFVIALVGFMIGKLSSGKNELSENDRELRDPEPMIRQKLSTSGSGSKRDRTSNHPSRPAQKSSYASFEHKLLKMEEIVRSNDVLDKSRAMLNFIDSLAPEEFEAAMARYESMELTGVGISEGVMLLTAWANVDPLAALAYAGKRDFDFSSDNDEDPTYETDINTVLSAWAKRDPEAAIAWAKANHQGDGANENMVGIIRGIAETDQTRAIELLQEMQFGYERRAALKTIIPQIAKYGFEEAKQWIDEIEIPRLREGAIAYLSEEMARKDPAASANWLLSNLTTVTERSVEKVFSSWAKVDQTAAISSFESLPQGDARSKALLGLVNAEISEDPAAAAQLMSRYPDDLTDEMVSEFVWNATAKAPEIAYNQIALIKDEEARNRLRLELMRFRLMDN